MGEQERYPYRYFGCPSQGEKKKVFCYFDNDKAGYAAQDV